jgi:hypothetical protein
MEVGWGLESRVGVRLTVCLHERGFSVSDAAVASDTAQKIGLFLSLDPAVASDTENHCPCKWAFRLHMLCENFKRIVIASI